MTESNDEKVAQERVKSYVMSDQMADNLKATVIDQLQLDEVINNKGVLVVGNYGTGKSHLMSVISAIAKDRNNLEYLQNKKFKEYADQIAGKFEVLRIEIGGVTMSLREILFGFIEEDLKSRGVDFTTPDFKTVKDNKQLITDMMTAFGSEYPDKGYLIIVDEFLAYLETRNEREITLDLEFLRALGEMCSKSKLRVIFGVQEKIFDNPRFSFVADTLRHVSDRFTQIIITKEDTEYVVTERILKKTPEQKAMIRDHLEKFSALYTGMASKLDQFVELYPIHPAYIDVFNKIHVYENRHVLKDISKTIKEIFDKEVPEDAPGIYSFDNSWDAIRNNGLLRSEVTISKVVNASNQLEEIVRRSFTKAAYKPLAIQIIHALSVHRLTTASLDVQNGLTAENLKDDLCLYLPMPEQDAEFLLGVVDQTLKDIMTTVSGQFIIHNEANNQYFIDVDKVIDYDEKVKQKASIMADSEFNRYFYDVVYKSLEWSAKQYVTNFNIYQYEINWESHNMYRLGYLFLGLPGERSTAQPERDFYIHFMPPFGNYNDETKDLKDEVYLYFKQDETFKGLLSLYAAASSLRDISEGKDKQAYDSKADIYERTLKKYLSENKNTCFNVSYRGSKKQIIEVLGSKYSQDHTFKDVVDLVASVCFDDYFCEKYPEHPVMKTKITSKNEDNVYTEAIDFFSGRKSSQPARLVLQSLELLDANDRIKFDNSKYATYYVKQLEKLPPQGVLNQSDIFDLVADSELIDKKFNMSYKLTTIVLLSLVYSSMANLQLKDELLTVGKLDKLPSMYKYKLYDFKYLAKPTGLPVAELKKLFEVLGLNPALFDNPAAHDETVKELLKAAQGVTNSAVMTETTIINNEFRLWGEDIIPNNVMQQMRNAKRTVSDEFTNYNSKYNTYARLNNFSMTFDEIKEMDKNIQLLNKVGEYSSFKSGVESLVNYIVNVETFKDEVGADFAKELTDAKEKFRTIRDSILDGKPASEAIREVTNLLGPIKKKYISFYMDEHRKKRLNINDSQKRGEVQSSVKYANLKKLCSLDKYLSTSRFVAVENDLADLKTCYELTETELKENHLCPHCHFMLSENSKNVTGRIDNIELQIDSITEDWTKKLLDTISDPLIVGQKTYLNKDQQKAIDEFIKTKQLPRRVDDFFINSINVLLKGFEPIVIDADDLVSKLEQLPPMDESSFEKKLNEIVGTYTKGKDPGKIRILVKKSEGKN
ncbi:MAG: hypothetical protein IJI66_03020 [Erysipelotrichaceae bacterium]|nr:hypothetical protein [Erysipelotrichaceae bacterium]